MMAASKCKAELTRAANAKIATGGLMTLAEVAALLDLAMSTVHALPIESIRIGRSLRFDPNNVTNYIDACREPATDFADSSAACALPSAGKGEIGVAG